MKYRNLVFVAFGLSAVSFGGGVQAATCDLALGSPVTGGAACTIVETQVGLTMANDVDESPTVSMSSAEQDSPEQASGASRSVFPSPTGLGAEIGAESSVSAAGGTDGPISAAALGTIVGEFTATGPVAGAEVVLPFNLGISGVLSTLNNNSNDTALATMSLSLLAIDSGGDVLAAFTGIANLVHSDAGSEFFNTGFDPGSFTESDACDGAFECAVTASGSQVVDVTVTEGETFGLFLQLSTLAVAGSGTELAATADFLDTVTVNVDLPTDVQLVVSPPTAVPLPAGIVLLASALLLLGGRAKVRGHGACRWSRGLALGSRNP